MIFPVLVALLPVVLALGIYLGGHPGSLPAPLRDAFVDDTVSVYDEALETIEDGYYREVERDQLLNRSLESAVASLRDRFSHYFDPKAYGEFREATTGEFEGVGMTVQEHPRGLEVLTVFEGGPAEKAGLKTRDVIVAVNGRSLKGRSSEQSTARIKGPAGTEVRLTVRTPGRKQRVLEVTRAPVNVPVVQARMEHLGEREIGYVGLASFTTGSHGDVRREVRELLKKGADGVVLDLRDNGGGLLNEAVLTASIFIPEGTIVTTRGRSRPSRTFEATGNPIDTKVPVVVLVNRNSASASEIVTGALQDRKRALVVGTRTFGKGVFQEISELSNGGALDLTVGEYFTPGGRNLGPRNGSRGGIDPDVEARDRSATPQRDEALEVALRTVTRKTA